MKSLAVAPLAVFLLVACGQSTRSNTDGGPTSGAPTITSFTANPTNLPSGGGSVTLSWTVTGAVSLSISNGPGTVTPVTSGSVTGTVTATTTFTLSATNTSGTSTATATVTVATGPTAPTINSFTITAAGGSNWTFAWDVTGATTLFLSAANADAETALTPVTTGSTTLSVTVSTVFGLLATNATGTTIQNDSITFGGDYAPGFVGSTYVGTWGFLQGSTLVAPPGTGIVDSATITETATNELQVNIVFEWPVTTFDCTGSNTVTVTTPYSYTETVGSGGFVCTVTGDPNCDSYTLTANGTYGTGTFDPNSLKDDLIVTETYTASGSSVAGCNGSLTFQYDLVP